MLYEEVWNERVEITEILDWMLYTCTCSHITWLFMYICTSLSVWSGLFLEPHDIPARKKGRSENIKTATLNKVCTYYIGSDGSQLVRVVLCFHTSQSSKSKSILPKISHLSLRCCPASLQHPPAGSVSTADSSTILQVIVLLVFKRFNLCSHCFSFMKQIWLRLVHMHKLKTYRIHRHLPFSRVGPQ